MAKGYTVIEGDKEKAYLYGVSVKVEIPDFTFRNREQLREFKRSLRNVHRQGIDEGREILKQVLVEKDLVATGKLFKSVASRLFVSSEDIFTGTIHFNKPGHEYAYFVEHGRGPGFAPPVSAMLEWGTARGLSLSHIFNIRKKIGKDGTEPHPFMEEAEQRIQENYQELVDNAVERFKREIS